MVLSTSEKALSNIIIQQGFIYGMCNALGFGGAFTDSAGYNINLMKDEIIINKIIEAYYDPKNIDYSIGRVNIGGCDFSTR